jgi:hypothetical protein
MGHVKVDINKNERQYQLANFSDIEVVKGLLLLRHKLDRYDCLEETRVLDAGSYTELNQQLIILYADLDVLIDKCQFGESQLALLKLLQAGLTFEDIESFVAVTAKNSRRAFNSICKRIVQQNNEDWIIWATFNHIPSEWKTCSKCGESLPLNERFFNKKDDSKDGFRSICSKCYSLSQK